MTASHSTLIPSCVPAITGCGNGEDCALRVRKAATEPDQWPISGCTVVSAMTFLLESAMKSAPTGSQIDLIDVDFGKDFTGGGR